MEAHKLTADLARLVDLLLREQQGRVDLGQRVRLDGLLLNYIEALRGEGRRPRYVADVEGSLRHALGFLQARRLDEIDSGALLRYRAALLSSGLSIRTAEKKVHAVCSWLTWLEALGVAPVSAPKIKRSRVREDQLRHDRRALSHAELDAYLGAHVELDRLSALASRRTVPQAPLYLTLAVTGCRWSEAAGALWGDLEGLTLRIGARFSKSRRLRVVPITEQASQLLERLRRSASEPIFRGVRGIGRIKHRPALRRHDCALELAGIARRDSSGRVVDLHALRVSAITGWLEAGLSLSEVQALAGHTDIRVTAGYARHAASDVLRRAGQVGRTFPALDQQPPDSGTLPFEPPTPKLSTP